MLCKKCPTYFPLGCVKHCEVLDLNLVAPVSGLYTYVVNGISKFQFTKNVTASDNLTIDTSLVNECAELCLEIFLPDGSLLSFTEEDCTYKGFKLETIIYV